MNSEYQTPPPSRPSLRTGSHKRQVDITLLFQYTWIAFIKPWFKFEYGFCPTSDNQDGQENGRRLWVSAVVIIFNRISSKFHMCITSIEFSFEFEYSFVQRTLTMMANNMAAAYQFTLVDTLS